MVENVARTVLKEGIKAWIAATERLHARLAQLREEIEDVVVEARYEYEHPAESTPVSRPAQKPVAGAPAAKSKASGARTQRNGTGRKPRSSKVAV